MIGCMIESSLLIAAGCVAAQQANYADLDGAWLLGPENDPCLGWTFSRGLLTQPAPHLGLGAELKQEVFEILRRDPTNTWANDIWETRFKQENPATTNTTRRARTHGFLVRMKTRGGRAVINARRAKGRKRLAA